MNSRSSRKIDSSTSLTFGETYIRESDIKLLQNKETYLNENLIAFYLEYLESRVYTSYGKILCVAPQITRMIQLTPAHELGAFLEPLYVDQKELMVFPLTETNQENAHVNYLDFSNIARESALTEFINSEQHWSLLVYSKWDKSVFHYDSLAGHNRTIAMNLGEKLLIYFGCSGKFEVKEQECLQQTNHVDCAIHMLCNAENILAFGARNRTVYGCPMLTEDQIAGFRKKALKLIWNLKHKSSVMLKNTAAQLPRYDV